MAGSVSFSITAGNTFSDAIYIGRGQFAFSMTAGTGTLHLQRAHKDVDETPGASDWRDVDSWTADAEENGTEPVGAWYRAGLKTGNYTSGTFAGLIRQ